MQFESKTLEQYWCCTMTFHFSRLCEKALSMLIPFATTYLCKFGLSTFWSIKNKSRNSLNSEVDMQIAISNKVPRFEKKKAGTKK